MAKRKRKATLHSAGKVTEADILERARALADDPSLAIPHYEGGFLLFNPVKSAESGIRRAHAARDDDAKLLRLASRGNDLARAYAATLLVSKAEKLPFVADLRLPSGNVPYVIRGSAKPFFLAGLQHHHDRELRLLSVAPWVKKRGLFFYSADRGLVCTGKRPHPPRDFVEEEAALLDLVAASNDRFTCPHASDRDVAIVTWRSVGVTFERCVECAEGGSMLHEILRHVAGPRPSSGFDAGARLLPLRIASGAPLEDAATLDEATVRDYRSGRLDDKGLVEAMRAARVQNIRRSTRRALVAEGTSYGDDVDAFLAALAPTEAEERALRAGLTAHEGALVLERASAARALAELWPRQGRIMLEAAARDADVAAKLFREEVSSEEASDLVRRAAKEGARGLVLTMLPVYVRLPPVAATADAIARAFRAEGASAAVRVALERAATGKGKGVALAALTHLRAGQGQEWRFSHADQDVAQSIAGPVQRLLEGDAEGYHEALELASRLSGETAEFTPRQP